MRGVGQETTAGIENLEDNSVSSNYSRHTTLTASESQVCNKLAAAETLDTGERTGRRENAEDRGFQAQQTVGWWGGSRGNQPMHYFTYRCSTSVSA